LEVLDGDECRRLLASDTVGRLGVVRGGYAVILPVNYQLVGDRVVVRTDAGGKFSAARQRRVGFEVDHIDRRRRTGWSVLMQGFAVEIGPEDPRYEAIASLPVEPWAPGARDRLLLITPITMTGRRLTRGSRNS